jgi:hypothetical protein
VSSGQKTQKKSSSKNPPKANLLTLASHTFGHLEYLIFVVVFCMQAQCKNQIKYTKFNMDKN